MGIFSRKGQQLVEPFMGKLILPVDRERAAGLRDHRTVIARPDEDLAEGAAMPGKVSRAGLDVSEEFGFTHGVLLARGWTRASWTSTRSSARRSNISES
jgi:hypothetical protein